MHSAHNTQVNRKTIEETIGTQQKLVMDYKNDKTSNLKDIVIPQFYRPGYSYSLTLASMDTKVRMLFHLKVLINYKSNY